MLTYIYFIIFIIGASTASFLNVVAHDLPVKANWAMRRSACSHCHRTLKATQLIPILSYVFQKGRCRSCHTQISPLYPLTEIAGGLLFIIPFILLGDFSLLQLAHNWIFFSFLITITLTDTYHGLIPNKILVTFGLILLIMQPNIFSAVIGFSLFFIAACIGKWLFKKATLGGGDIKCYFVIGLAIELNTLLLSIVISCLLALLYILFISKDRHAAIRFAPFISLGVLIAMIISSLLATL